MSKIRIAKSKLADGIYLLRFKSQYELAATFLRVQEHYESPRFHGRVFSLEQFMDWYAKRYGNFTYYEDWAGFNVPSTALQPFYDGRFDPLSEKEKELLRLFKDLKERYYVIGICESDAKDSLTHELAHALYFTDASYRREVQRAIRAYKTTKLAKQIADLGTPGTSFLTKSMHIWFRLRESSGRRARSSHCEKSSGRSLGSALKKCLFQRSAECLRDIGDRLLLAEIVTVPDGIRGAEVVGRAGEF